MGNLALLRLTERLALNSSKIVEEVRFAIEEPDNYFFRFKEKFKERGMEKPSEELPWIVLLDALIEAELAYEIDWKESTLEITYAIDDLSDRKKIDSLDWDWIENMSDAMPTGEKLQAIADRMYERSLSLAYLDIDSDSYILVVVPNIEISELIDLALKAGHTISSTFI
ncbi:DUF6630 family protein [Paenibacillus glacialis]|uniref:DUF6630 domain-containing protein n=1 Tax=Paenibacillus glacialis TaxID=494026 RepID=A0A168N881_9BACL|nr:DUF6630 family protein [Paenibacillus glacialis]OAB45509.1 hypothetical protein PGLA_04460 [Paenibacillus glacialis]